MSCSTTSGLCNSIICRDGCPREFYAVCVEYTGTPLSNIPAGSGDTLEKILYNLNLNLSLTKTPFVAISDNSIYAVGGGVLGHSPTYHIRINPNDYNSLVLEEDGLFVSKDSPSDGKVKVDEDDEKDYLEGQFGADSDGIVTITPTKEGGKIKFVPQIDVDTLLDIINSSYKEEFCSIVNDC